MKSTIVIIGLITIWLQSLSASVTTGFFYSGGVNGSYITNGSAKIIAPGEWTFYPPVLIYQGSNAVDFRMFNLNSYSYWTIDIQAPEDGRLQVGEYIATRFPFQESSLMGFSWSGFGRAWNTSTSLVKVLEVQYVGSDITALAIDFVQAGETWGRTTLDLSTDKYDAGSFRYKSVFPINTNVPVPEPAHIYLIGFGLVLICFRRKK